LEPKESSFVASCQPHSSLPADISLKESSLQIIFSGSGMVH
jgi:hypothetical protein